MKNKTVIVTGAGSGLGRAIAHKFAENGANVVVSDIAEDDAKKVVKEITDKKGTAFFIKADTSKAKECEQLVKQAVAKYGKLHYAVNNAGIGAEMAKTAESSGKLGKGNRRKPEWRFLWHEISGT